MIRPEVEFASDYKSLLPTPAIYFDWEGMHFSVLFGWMFWNIKFEWEK